jgi:hypothetical protein
MLITETIQKNSICFCPHLSNDLYFHNNFGHSFESAFNKTKSNGNSYNLVFCVYLLLWTTNDHKRDMDFIDVPKDRSRLLQSIDYVFVKIP